MDHSHRNINCLYNTSEKIEYFMVEAALLTLSFLEMFRAELLEEKKKRPILAPDTTLSGWWEGCQYSCKLCHVTTTSQTAFENHLTSAHDITGQEEIKSKYLAEHGSLATVTRLHDCYICGKAVRHEHKMIVRHLAKHRLDIENYTRTFRSKLVGELKVKGMNYVVEREQEKFDSVSLDTYLKTNIKDKESSDDSLMESWYDCSQHKCGICDAVFWSNLKFHWHIKRVHGISSTRDYRRDQGDPEVRVRQHQCQVCGSMIKWEASRLRDHLKQAHTAGERMSLKQYGDKFRDYIISEVKKIKMSDAGDGVRQEYSVKEWKQLFTKKHSPHDRVECNLCKREVSRHSYPRHRERAHKGVIDLDDLKKLKRNKTKNMKSEAPDKVSEVVEQIVEESETPNQGEETKIITNVETVISDKTDSTEKYVDNEATTYFVDNETGEILNVTRSEDVIEEQEDDDPEEESDTGPLYGQVMEIDDHDQDHNTIIAEEDVKIIILNDQLESSVENFVVAETVDNASIVVEDDTGAVMVSVDQDDDSIVVEDETGAVLGKIKDTAAEQVFSQTWDTLTEDNYSPKQISKAKVESDGRVSEGTVVCSWTKMAADRTRISSNKLIIPTTSRSCSTAVVDKNISSTVLYSSPVERLVMRDVSCQTSVNKVNSEEERQQAEMIRRFVMTGAELDRVCPGCGKNMSRTRNLISHIKIIHGVELNGAEKEEHETRHERENVRVQCGQCSKIVSRKSIRRHMKLCHPDNIDC